VLTKNVKSILFFAFGFLLLSCVASRAQQTKPRFTVSDEVQLAHFGDPYTGDAEAVQFSPDGKYFAVDTSRGRFDLNCVEDSLRFYLSQEIENFLNHSNESQPPSAVWVVTRRSKEGPVIRSWRWLPNSSGIAFLEHMTNGDERLVLADLQKKIIEPLTSAGDVVGAFDIRDDKHFVYTVADKAEGERIQVGHQVALVGTGIPLVELILPEDPRAVRDSSLHHNLWAVLNGTRFEVKEDGRLIHPEWNLVLSPDGESLVTILLAPDVPSSWETLYPPPYPSATFRIHAGKPAHQYVRIDVRTGSVQMLTDAPISNDAGWWAGGDPTWSNDGREILLPGTFIRSEDQVPSRPCVAVVDLVSNTRICVETLKAYTETGVEEGYHLIDGIRFVRGDNQRVMVRFHNHGEDWTSIGTNEYRRMANGTWQFAGQSKGELYEDTHEELEVTVKQGLNEPPRLVATHKQLTRVILDPNPQLKNLDLGQASVYNWKDKQGRSWKGGLFTPTNYKEGQRYPLVIQTHGFTESEFRPSGVFPTGFAARALAGSGIMVLQTASGVGETRCPTDTPEEGPCNIGMLESAIKQLVADGLVDPDRIGIIGFSRTCFSVMEMLTKGSFRVKAASISDGVMATYLQYMDWVDFSDDGLAHEFDSLIGAKPFGEGLQQWLKQSPGFNLDKVNAPLLVNSAGRVGLLTMWEPYAGLRYLNKPVDLIVLNTDEHILTNPVVRIVSQGGSVDWFRFWLQNYEDPDPTKADQYKRWRQLREVQAENDAKDNAARDKTVTVN